MSDHTILYVSINSSVKGYEALQHLSVGRVHNSIFFQMDDDAPPYRIARATCFVKGRLG